jgi:outer membrane protein
MNATRVTPYLLLTILLGATARADEPKEARARFDAQIVSLLARPGGLTSDKVAEQATATSLDIEARRKDVEVAEAVAQQSWMAFLPRLSGLASFARNSALGTETLGVLAAPAPGATPFQPLPKDWPLVPVPLAFTIPDFETIFRVALTIPVSDYLLRTVQGYQAASHSESAAKLTEQATRLKVSTDARVAYYAWVRAKLQLVVAQAALEQAKEHLADIKPAYDVGSASKADVMQFESRESAAELLVERAANASRILEERLRVAMHDSQNAPYEVGEGFSDAVVDVPGLDTPDAAFAASANRRLEIKAIEEQVNTLDWQKSQTRAGFFPRIDLVGDVTDANPNPRVFPPTQNYTTTWSAGIQASWVVNDTINTIATHKAATARLESVDAQRRALLDGLRTEVYQAVQDVHETQVALQTTARGLAAAEESYRVRRSLFKSGRATATELTDAEADLTRARLENLNARVDARIAKVRFTHASGLDAG